MKINNKQLVGLPVETESGQSLGRICGWELMADGSTISHYEVRPSILFLHITKRFLISPSQVISVDSERMVVEDNVEKIVVGQKKKRPRTLEDASPVSMSKR